MQSSDAVAELQHKRALALRAAIDDLENLSIGAVQNFDSYDSLEAGCLSCSGVKIDET